MLQTQEEKDCHTSRGKEEEAGDPRGEEKVRKKYNLKGPKLSGDGEKKEEKFKLELPDIFKKESTETTKPTNEFGDFTNFGQETTQVKKEPEKVDFTSFPTDFGKAWDKAESKK